MLSLTESMDPTMASDYVRFPCGSELKDEDYVDADCMSNEEYEKQLLDTYVQPTSLEWCFIPLFAILFLVGLVGNFLVTFVVLRNPTMRTITNIFLVNLAVADFLVILLCLPFTVLWDITNTWFFGTPLCKLIVYVQTVSVAVSVLTLTAISVERWYAICRPLAFHATLKRTMIVISAVWIVSCIVSMPELFILEAIAFNFTKPGFKSTLFTNCKDTWAQEHQQLYQLLQAVILFVIPLIIIAVMYGLVAYQLWIKAIPAHTLTSTAPNGQSAAVQSLIESMEKEILQRRKVAKMLIAVVILFAVCYLPVHVMNLFRYLTTIMHELSATSSSLIMLISRSLTYLNSCVNPIIYNFMSEKFRREYKRACICIPKKLRFYQPGIPSETAANVYQMHSVCKNTIEMNEENDEESKV